MVTPKIATQVVGNQQSHIFIRSGGPKGWGIHGFNARVVSGKLKRRCTTKFFKAGLGSPAPIVPPLQCLELLWEIAPKALLRIAITFRPSRAEVEFDLTPAAPNPLALHFNPGTLRGNGSG
jgi:hypothetical protein